MNKDKKRRDDYEQRRQHLKDKSDRELKQYFWSLTEKAVDPLIKLAKTHTSPAIERSVLLRMGFSSLEAKAIVGKTIEHGLIGKGAGHVVYRLSSLNGQPVREAGKALMEDRGWDKVKQSFGVATDG
jgi:D-ornithine 4,5-aminomutase subunit alpha